MSDLNDDAARTLWACVKILWHSKQNEGIHTSVAVELLQTELIADPHAIPASRVKTSQLST